MITSTEKRIYNTFLAISRKKQNKPFKLRQDFEDFEQDEKFPAIKKLAYFFERFPNIDINDYFLAPYSIYVNDENTYYDLQFYLSQKARSVYTMHMKKKESVDADSEENLKKCRESLMFIYKYCKSKDCSVKEYLVIKEENSLLPAFAVHLKHRDINVYALFAFEDFENKFFQIPADLLEFIFGSLYNDFAQLRRKFVMSEKCKQICRSGLKIIETKS